MADDGQMPEKGLLDELKDKVQDFIEDLVEAVDELVQPPMRPVPIRSPRPSRRR